MSEGAEENLSKYKGEEGKVLRWLKELKLVQDSKSQKAFEKNGEKIVKDYRNAQAIGQYETVKSQANRIMFNVLWANTQVLKPALYSGMPDIVVERMFRDVDPIGRLASQVCERATYFMLESDEDKLNFALTSAVEDRLLPGRGQIWLRYDAEFDEMKDENGEPIVDESTGEAIKRPKPNSEKVCVDYVHWCDYFESTARTPYEVRWRARRVYMTRSQLVSKFGDIGSQVKLTLEEGNKKKYNDDEIDFLSQAEVFEIWDGESKNVYWISEGYLKAPLRELKDPLRLKDFYPCPIPLLATTTTDSTYPTPDFKIYEKLAEEYDFVCKRESGMIECVRFVGATAAQFNKDVKNMLTLKDGSLWPVENWAIFAEKGGFKGIIDWLPFENIIAALPALTEYKQNILNQIYEITGIPDIARGLTDPNETLGAQKKKLRSLGTKTEEKARDVARFIREIYSKCSEIIFEPGLFSDETIRLMCGADQMSEEDQALFPQALQLLRDDRLKTFRIDVETTTTSDEELEREGRMQFLSTLTQIVGSLEQISQFRPELMEPLIESAQFALATFKNGRAVTGAFEAAWTKIEEQQKMAEQNPPPAPPDYQAQALQIESQKVQLEGQKAQGDFEIQTQKVQIESQKIQLEGQKAQAEFELETKKLDIEAQKVLTKAQIDQMDQELKTFKEQYSQFIQSKTLELEQYRVVLDEKEKFLEEARLKAQNVDKPGNNGGMQLHVKSDHPITMVQAHPKRRIVKAQRMPDGSLVGESIDITDESNVN